jgi:site-specific DNA recombinase
VGTTAQAGTAAVGTVPPAFAGHAPAVGTVPVAWVGRTSTSTMQDPAESLLKQLRRSRERLPAGFVITRYYWDVESGGTDLDLRSQSGTWQKFAAAGIPRDGGMAELRTAIKASRPPFAAVICENIERTGRDNYDALRLEKELNAAGVLLLATDEPIDAAAPEAAGILVRRVKQGIAEWYRYNLKAQMWEGLKQYAISGHNTGPAPYGYLEQRTTHPNPMKASMGATRARLVPDPERGPWVTRMFEWRVYEKLSVPSIVRRLDETGAPAPDPAWPWSYQTVYNILRNPKYTGKIVIGRTRGTGTPGKRKVRAVPREHWTWAADGNEHPALIPMELWEAAQTAGRDHGNVRDHQAGRQRHDYPLRSRIRCAQCSRRMVVKPTQPYAGGPTYTYYVCPHSPSRPRDAAKAPGHIRASIPDYRIHAAVDHIISGLLGHDRAAMLAGIFPATQADHDQRSQARTEELSRKLNQNETAQAGLITQLEQLGADTGPAARAMRERITAQFTDRYNQAKTLQSELDALTASTEPAPDLTLLDELPYAAANLTSAPDPLKARLYAAFDIQALHRAPKNQATIWATITPATPGIVAALLTDPRTDSDTLGNVTPAPIAAGITTKKKVTVIMNHFLLLSRTDLTLTTSAIRFLLLSQVHAPGLKPERNFLLLS